MKNGISFGLVVFRNSINLFKFPGSPSFDRVEEELVAKKKKCIPCSIIAFNNDTKEFTIIQSRSHAEDLGFIEPQRSVVPPTRDQMRFLGESMIMFAGEDGEDKIFNFIMFFEGKGAFEPDYDKIDVTKEEANIHNNALSEALIKGLDESCKIGQGGSFYYSESKITTFTGTLVTKDVVVTKGKIRFVRNGKMFEGKLPEKDSSLFFFERVQ